MGEAYSDSGDATPPRVGFSCFHMAYFRLFDRQREMIDSFEIARSRLSQVWARPTFNPACVASKVKSPINFRDKSSR